MVEPKCFRGHGLVLRVGEVVVCGARWSEFNPSSLRMFSLYSQVQGGRKQHTETANLKLLSMHSVMNKSDVILGKLLV